MINPLIMTYPDSLTAHTVELYTPPNIPALLRGVFFLAGALYLWRSGFRPKKSEPQRMLDRWLRVIGALLLSAVTAYLIGLGLGFWGD